MHSDLIIMYIPQCNILSMSIYRHCVTYHKSSLHTSFAVIQIQPIKCKIWRYTKQLRQTPTVWGTFISTCNDYSIHSSTQPVLFAICIPFQLDNSWGLSWRGHWEEEGRAPLVANWKRKENMLLSTECWTFTILTCYNLIGSYTILF